MHTISPADIVVGVDTHKHAHAAVALSGLGARLGAITVPASLKGYRELETWACSFGTVRALSRGPVPTAPASRALSRRAGTPPSR
jgi:hypothetical protein